MSREREIIVGPSLFRRPALGGRIQRSEIVQQFIFGTIAIGPNIVKEK
jgi:hypothetical protein